MRQSAKRSSVAPAVRDNYIAIIDAILADSDLTKISEKKIRAGIQEKVEYDITPQKVAHSRL
jgi:upstream activation factor subunit UAF30